MNNNRRRWGPLRLLVGLLLLAVGVPLLAYERGPWFVLGRGMVPTPSGVSGVLIQTTDDAQTIVNAHSPGTTFVIKSGYHRMQTITPHDGDTFIGEAGAIMSGARDLTPGVVSWTHISNCHGGVECWYVDGQTQQGSLVDVGSGCSGSTTIEGTSWYPTCFYPEDVFFEGSFKYHCQVFANCPVGGWYLDYDGGSAGSLGSQPADRLYVFDNPSGHAIEASVTALAFDTGSSTNVTIQSLIIEHYATHYAEAAVTIVNGSVMNGVETRYNHYAGMAVGDSGLIENSHSHHNLCAGNIGGGSGHLTNDELDHNNYFREYDEFWGCGGSKQNVANGPHFSGSYFHDNIGPGIWCDTSCINQVYDSNTVDDNSRGGIFLEIGYSAVVSNNTIRRNGNGHFSPAAYPTESGIGLASTAQVEVFGNVLTDNYGSLQAIQEGRCSATGQPGQSGNGPWYVQNFNVHDNTVNLVNPAFMNQPGFIGIQRAGDGACPDPYSSGQNNKWTHNTYNVGMYATNWFTWSGGTFGTLNFAQWQAAGQDTTGSLTIH